jgi:hypothetical protein
MLNRSKSAFKKLKRRLWIDKPTWRFIGFNKAKWRRLPFEKKDSTILVDIFDVNPLIYCFSNMANYLADATNSSIASFLLARSPLTKLGIRERRLEKIYESFGAGLELKISAESEKKYKAQAHEFAAKTFAGLRTKWDVVDIKLEGLKIGDLIYDSYLKKGFHTVDIKSPLLFSILEEAYLIFQICKDFLRERNVQAIITSHTVYISHGILVRLAIEKDIPIYVLMDNDGLVITDIQKETYYHFKYHIYKKTFDSLSQSEKPKLREKARKILSERMLGAIDPGIADMVLEEGRPGLAGYGPVSKERILKDTGRPRVIVMLNCFFDAPHCYRNMLFPDFWEWIHFVLDKASQTDFDWYVKPHPGGLAANDLVVEELKKKYPKVTYMPRTASNKQILQEGISSMFTVFGTAAHEFAYVGVPVVTAGDNPHVNYDFNFHPQTINEYEKYIFNADKLKIDIDKAQIEEFFYMHYIYSYIRNEFGARLIDEECEYLKLGHKSNESFIFDAFIKGENPEKTRKVKAFFDQYFSRHLGEQKSEGVRHVSQSFDHNNHL